MAGLEDFAALSAEYAGSEDIAVISVVAPGLNGEVGKDDFTAWAKAQGIVKGVTGTAFQLDENGALTKEFGIRAYPTFVYLGKDGRLFKQSVGDESNERVIKELSNLGAQER